MTMQNFDKEVNIDTNSFANSASFNFFVIVAILFMSVCLAYQWIKKLVVASLFSLGYYNILRGIVVLLALHVALILGRLLLPLGAIGDAIDFYFRVLRNVLMALSTELADG